MTTNPDVLRLAEETARRLLVDKVWAEARQRFTNDATCPMDMTEHLIRVAGEYAAIAAIERTTELTVQFIDAAPMPGYIERADDPGMAAASHMSGSLEEYDHLRQPEKGSTDE